MVPVIVHMLSQVLILAFSIFSSIKLMLLPERVSVFTKFAAIVVLIVALWMVFRRDTYLPFLGYAAFPKSIIPNDFTPVNSNTEIQVPMEYPDGTRMIYWGALANNGEGVPKDPKTAYGDYSNAGVATIKGAMVTLRFHCPSEYYVPMGRKLKRHIHYRLCCERTGLLGPVRTLWVKC
jgi:hypothetical protein